MVWPEGEGLGRAGYESQEDAQVLVLMGVADAVGNSERRVDVVARLDRHSLTIDLHLALAVYDVIILIIRLQDGVAELMGVDAFA
jgi:hypothetical protein